MSDVTAVLLTTGEPSAADARESVLRQTEPVAAVVEVRDVRPFHRALNDGAGRVRTPFFIQVDADMVLDPDCVARLAAIMRSEPQLGVVIGMLRDDLTVRAVGVKMFRRECFSAAAMPDSISPDTDFIAAMRSAGWRDVYALSFANPDARLWHTFGLHRPDYGVRYALAKHILEGSRYRYRDDIEGLRWHAAVLDESGHPAARVARIGLLTGAFAGLREDCLGRGGAVPYPPEIDAITSGAGRPPVRVSGLMMGMAPTSAALFRRYYRLGSRLRTEARLAAFESIMDGLAESTDPLRWIAQAGLCRGALAGSGAGGDLASDLASLKAMVPWKAAWIRSRLRAVVGWLASQLQKT